MKEKINYFNNFLSSALRSVGEVEDAAKSGASAGEAPGSPG